MTDAPPRGFPQAEFEARLARIQRAMSELQLDAMLLTTEPDVRYVTGFLTQFWESPTRPWFAIVPAEGKPIGVIPEIGAAGMRSTWIEDIRTWPSPRPADDGVSLLTNALKSLPKRHDRIGAPLGQESHLRMPANDARAVFEALRGVEIIDTALLMHRIRVVNSPAEIAKIRHACGIAGAGFAALPGFARIGMSEREICRQLRIHLLAGGADASPYLVAGSGPGGYDNIIMGPTDRELGAGDVLIIDTGTTYDGYFCDFDRNFAFGHVADDTRRANEVVHNSVDAGLVAARPGATTSDLWAAMWRVLEAGGALGNDVGRMGHGLGMQLTEWPSLTEDDGTVLEAGMVLTLEPGMEFAPQRQMVHEENIVITEDGAELLTPRAPADLPIIQA